MWCIKYEQFLNGKLFFQFFLLSKHCIFSANKCKEYNSLKFFMSVPKGVKIIFHKNLLFQEHWYGKMHLTLLNWHLEQNTWITIAFLLYALWVEKSLYFYQHYTSHASKTAHFRHVCALDGTQVEGRKEIQIIGSSTNPKVNIWLHWLQLRVFLFHTSVYLKKKISSHAFCLLSTYLRDL